jgi:hypothetical protein
MISADKALQRSACNSFVSGLGTWANLDPQHVLSELPTFYGAIFGSVATGNVGNSKLWTLVASSSCGA